MDLVKNHRKLLSFALSLATLPALAVVSGTPAPDFKGTDSNGVQHSLSQYRGKYVVLEWHNQGCPYTRKHYVSGNMQNLQKEWTAKGVAWFTVISSAVNGRLISCGSRKCCASRVPVLPRLPSFNVSDKCGFDA